MPELFRASCRVREFVIVIQKYEEKTALSTYLNEFSQTFCYPGDYDKNNRGLDPTERGITNYLIFLRGRPNGKMNDQLFLHETVEKMQESGDMVNFQPYKEKVMSKWSVHVLK